MKCSEIDDAYRELKANFAAVGTKIDTAIKHHGQLHHANYRTWYKKRMRLVQLRFLILRRRLFKLSGFSTTFNKIDAQLRILNDERNDAVKLRDAYRDGSWSVKSLGSQIRRKEEENFDVFTSHRGEVSTDRRLCFVMMPFKPENVFNRVAKAIRRAVRGKRVRYVRSDNIFDVKAIILDIWENIRKSRVCVADVSPPWNPNVFYEVGLAHTLPKQVILISRKLESGEKFPFDQAMSGVYSMTLPSLATKFWNERFPEHFEPCSNRVRKL